MPAKMLDDETRAMLQQEWQEKRDELAKLYKKIQRLEAMLNPLRIQYHNAASRFRQVDRELAEERVKVIETKARAKAKVSEDPLVDQLLNMTPSQIDQLARLLTDYQKKGQK